MFFIDVFCCCFWWWWWCRWWASRRSTHVFESSRKFYANVETASCPDLMLTRKLRARRAYFTSVSPFLPMKILLSSLCTTFLFFYPLYCTYNFSRVARGVWTHVRDEHYNHHKCRCIFSASTIIIAFGGIFSPLTHFACLPRRHVLDRSRDGKVDD